MLKVARWALDLVDLLVSLTDEKLTRVKRTYQVRCSHELSSFRFSSVARRPSCQYPLRRGIIVVEVGYKDSCRGEVGREFSPVTVVLLAYIH